LKTRNGPFTYTYEKGQDSTGRWYVQLRISDGDDRATRDIIANGLTEREAGRFIILAEKGGLSNKWVSR
jgi:hypothetical protein